MIKKHASLIVSLLLLFSVTPVFSAGSVSITSVSIPDSVGQGSSFTISIYVSGSQASSVKGSLTLPSGLSCTPSTPQDISLTSSGTGSASWSCTADLSGTYASQITASVSATDSSTGGSLSDSEQVGLNVPAPASLVLSSSLSSSSINTSSSSSLTIALHNTGGESTNYSISISSAPSGISSSVSSGSATGDISGGSVTNTIYSISGTSANTHTVTATITGGNGQTLLASNTLTITVPASTSTTSSISSITLNISSNQTTNQTTANQTQTSVASVNQTGAEDSQKSIDSAPNKTKIDSARRLEKARGIINNTKLAEALEKVLTISNLSAQAFENIVELSEKIQSSTIISKEAKAESGITVVKTVLKYEGNISVKNFTIYQTVPKSFAKKARDIIISAPRAIVSVVNPDPEYLITYADVNPGDELSVDYTVNKEISSSSELTSVKNSFTTELYADSTAQSLEAKYFCTPDSTRCSSDNLEKCSFDGLSWAVVRSCDAGCEGNQCRIFSQEEPKTSEIAGNMLIPIIFALVGLFILIGLAYYLHENKIDLSPYSKKKKSKKKK